MRYTLKNAFISYSLDEQARVCSIINVRLGHEYCHAPGELFRLLYKVEDFEERSVNAADQEAPEIAVQGDTMRVLYPTLKGPDGVLDIRLEYTMTLEDDHLSVTARIDNQSQVQVMELQTTAFAGIQALNGDSKKDCLIVPAPMGHRIHDPAHTDFFHHSSLIPRKYDRPDYRHSDLDIPYPAFSSMQWFSLYNQDEAIYVGNHDMKHRITCLHTERRVADNTLRLGTVQYPFLLCGESYVIPPVVYAILDGDWHSAARFYRRWMVEDYGWKPPVRPQWAQEFQGWLRCIFRTQSGEFNFHFTDIPRLFDQIQAVGLNTLFILGWPMHGFGRYRGDYEVDPRYLDDLKKGIEYVHGKGGKVFMFMSYLALDKKSNYYKNENGEAVLVRDLWNDYVRFSETYGMDGTYRKLLNLPHSQYCTCSGSDQWHQKMLKTADYCLGLGADGVLYDLGGYRPLFCCAEGHDHKKPNEARSSKSMRYADLRRNVKEKGDRVIMQEHCVDIYAQHMDIVQPTGAGCFLPHDLDSMPEVYRYTFPEIVMTNRGMGFDEENMLDNCNYTFMYGLAFDFSIFRCAGTPEDIPNYAAYARKLIALRKQYGKYFFYGTFLDEDGFTTSGSAFRQKSYRAADGSLGIAIWNASDGPATQTYTNTETGATKTVTLDKDTVTFLEI